MVARLNEEDARLKALAALQKVLKAGDSTLNLSSLQSALDAAKEAQLFENALPVATRDWAGHLRRLDALDPSYRS